MKGSVYGRNGRGMAAIARATLAFVTSAIGASTLFGSAAPRAAVTQASIAILPMTHGYLATVPLIVPARIASSASGIPSSPGS